MKHNIHFPQRFHRRMKLVFPNLRLHARLLLGLMFLCGMAAAQDSVPQPKIREFGIRLNAFYVHHATQEFPDIIAKDRNHIYSIQAYTVRNIARENFIRFGLGYTRDHQMNSIFLVTPTSIGRDTANTTRHQVTYEVGFGHTFQQSKHAFWERLRLRAGITFTGTSMLYEKKDNSNWSQNIGATPQYSDASIVKFYNDHNLHLSAFWQVGFRVARHGLVGLEWQVGPNLNYRLFSSNQGVPTPVTGIGFVQARGLSSNLWLDWRHVISGPKLWAGVCF